MSFIELFRFPLSVSINKADEKVIESGSRKPSYMGRNIVDRFEDSEQWNFLTSLRYSNQRAQTLCSLIRGHYSYWNFEDGVPWSVDGVPILNPSDFTSDPAFKYGSKCALVNAGTLWDTQVRRTSKWAAWGWVNTGASFFHCYVDSGGNVRTDGVAGGTPHFNVTFGGYLEFVTAARYDDVVLVHLTEDMDLTLFDDYFYDFHAARAWSSSPTFRGSFADGVSVESEFEGVINSLPSISATINGVYDNNYRQIDFSLARA